MFGRTVLEDGDRALYKHGTVKDPDIAERDPALLGLEMFSIGCKVFPHYNGIAVTRVGIMVVWPAKQSGTDAGGKKKEKKGKSKSRAKTVPVGLAEQKGDMPEADETESKRPEKKRR